MVDVFCKLHLFRRKDPRAGLKSVLNAADMIRNGISIFLFPEGTRSKDCKLGEFKEGSFKIATKAKCPVIPVGIQGTYNIFETTATNQVLEGYCYFWQTNHTDQLDRAGRKAASFYC